MKQRRTKEQKLRAHRRQAVQPVANTVPAQKIASILEDIPLIQKDLRKTLAISLTLGVILIGIFWYLR
ncbi:MAG: hypothetical protein A2632_01700 [Candidatus Pacebacteria bacterium RIFCSPHIGHO2_01_FULL_46_16]|nr:MAG: hypothetical protein A2632_01700 [Candidatus Pacebacteria bacterium RIFCSPHIGHO2_01_FULL_46_16]OGJ21792.1 MAG: hypothetical protein A3J60_02895 [Candidatus Pacebacteria bacterium RIFCSPHIGHO2_02_FULL_46_9]